MKTRRLVFSEMALAILLNGCQPVPDATTTQLRNEGKPRAYIEGYDDGCKSGYFAAGSPKHKLARDATRFNYDAQYARGWSDGFAVCKAQYQGSDK